MRLSLHLNDRQRSALNDRRGATLYAGRRVRFGYFSVRRHKSSTIPQFGRAPLRFYTLGLRLRRSLLNMTGSFRKSGG